MRRNRIALALGASVLLPTVAIAAVPTANVLFAGTIKRQFLQMGSASLCMFDGTQSTFMRKTSPAAKLISFPDIMIAPNGSVGPTYYTVGGQGRLTFNDGSVSAGRIAFVGVEGYPTAVNTPRFNRYKESYDTATGILTVSFDLIFPYCTLPVAATYRN